MKIAAVHFVDPTNLGDQACCPLDYFSIPFDRIDLCEPESALDNYDVVVFGGGGLLFKQWSARLKQMANSVQKRGGKVIGWGFGDNTHSSMTLKWPTWLNTFNLIGLRDHGCPFAEFTPCPSCLSPLFDLARAEPTQKVVVYSHKDHPIDLSFPSMTNLQSLATWGATLDFLASGETIITNTYHGVYWGLLLGRRVLVWKPFSSRFYGFDVPITYVDETNWESARAILKPNHDYLGCCRAANRQFFEKVKPFCA